VSTHPKIAAIRNQARRWRLAWRGFPRLAKVTFVAGLVLLGTAAVLQMLDVRSAVVMGFIFGGILLGSIVTSVIRFRSESLKDEGP
jgi:hypothetical protein